MKAKEAHLYLRSFLLIDFCNIQTCVCVCVRQDGAEGAWLNESPTGGDEQAAANHIAYGHAANDDWRAEGKGECGQAGSLLKAQVGSLLRSRRVHESVCVCGEWK